MLICKLNEVSSYMYLFSLLYVLSSNKVDYTRNIRHDTIRNIPTLLSHKTHHTTPASFSPTDKLPLENIVTVIVQNKHYICETNYFYYGNISWQQTRGNNSPTDGININTATPQ